MRFRIALPLLLAAALAGCDSTPPAKPKAAAKAAPVAPPLKNTAAKPEPPPKRQRAPVQSEKVARLFQVPELSASESGKYDSRTTGGGQAPAIRLLGFSRMKDQVHALVEIKGEVLMIEQGDVVDGAEVVAVDHDGVSFQFAGRRWSNRLFEKRAGEPPVVTPASIARANPAPAPPVQGSSHIDPQAAPKP